MVYPSNYSCSFRDAKGEGLLNYSDMQPVDNIFNDIRISSIQRYGNGRRASITLVRLRVNYMCLELNRSNIQIQYQRSEEYFNSVFVSLTSPNINIKLFFRSLHVPLSKNTKDTHPTLARC